MPCFTDGKAVEARVPIRALVARRELPAEHLVRKFLRLLRERWVGLARVDEQRRLGLLEIFLQNSKCSLISPRRPYVNEKKHGCSPGDPPAPGGGTGA